MAVKPPATAKPKAISLHIGLNAVSAAAYSGWDGPLAACEFDANDMAALAKKRGMKPDELLTKNPVTAYRFARGLDDQFYHFADGLNWARDEWEAHVRKLVNKEPLETSEPRPLPDLFWTEAHVRLDALASE